VPDSGRAFASGYAEEAQGEARRRRASESVSGEAADASEDVEFAEGLMKNRYVGRTFIMPTQEARERAVRLKLNPIRSTVEGKSVTIIDDSIVRGTTSSQLVDLVREAGAEEVHVRIGAPPIQAPCYFGIDMATRDELIAADRTTAEVAAEVGADSLSYLSLDAVTAAIGKSQADLCAGCVTGEYPYEVDGEATDRPVQQPDVQTRADD